MGDSPNLSEPQRGDDGGKGLKESYPMKPLEMLQVRKLRILGHLVHPLTVRMGKLRPGRWCGFELQGLDPKAGCQTETEGRSGSDASPGTPSRSCGFRPLPQERTTIFTSACRLQHPRRHPSRGHPPILPPSPWPSPITLTFVM